MRGFSSSLMAILAGLSDKKLSYNSVKITQ